jgi:Flp pilus assembly protein TadD
VQDEIARHVVTALQVKLLTGQVPSVAASRPTNPEAYRLYLLGRQLESRGTPKEIEAGVHALEESTRLDRKYVPARVWLALARYGLANIGPSDPARQKEPAFDLPRASAGGLREAEAVIALAPAAAEGYWLRCYLRGAGRLYDWEGAVADCRRANSLSPGDVRMRLDYARVLATLGRLPEALALAQEAAESDPLSTEVYRWVGVFQAASGSVDLAAATLRHGLEVAPANAYLLRELAYAYVLLGSGEEALRVSERAPTDWIRSLGQALAYHQLGRDAESRLAIERLIEMHRGGVVRPTYQIAEAYAWRGEKERAFRWLELAFSERDGGMTYIRYDPLLRGLRSDPRYVAMLRKMNLPVE